MPLTMLKARGRTALVLAAALLLASSPPARAQDAIAALLEQARQQFNAGRHAEALVTYDRAIEIVTKAGGPNARRLGDVLAMKGYAHAMIGEREQAQACTERAVAIAEKAAGRESRDAILARLMLGAMHVSFGQVDQARAIYAKAVSDARSRFGETDAATLQVTESAAQAALRWGDAAEAVRLRRLVLAAQEKARGKDALETVTARSNLAHFLHAAGDVAGAEQAFEETLRALERRGMKDSAEAAAVRSNLGAVLSQRGEHARALAALEAALATYLKTEGRDSAAVATIRNNVASAKLELGRHDDALADYREIVAAFERSVGADHPLTLTAVNNLANVLARTQRSAEAVPLLERVAAGLRKAAPAGDPRVLSADANLAAAYKLVGRGADAVRIGEATLAAREKLLPPGHTDIGDSLGNLADSLMFIGEAERALETTDREQRNNRLRDARILAALTDAEQAAFVAEHTGPELEQALNVAVQARGVPRAAERGAVWLANAKGRGVEAAATRGRLAQTTGSQADAAAAAELATVRRQMATLVQMGPAAPAERVREQLEALAERERVLVRTLGVSAGDEAAAAWVEIDAIRAGLPPRAVLVDIARFSRVDFSATASGRRLHEARYVAWIVPAAGGDDVRVVDLGEAATIDAAVAAYRRELEAAAAAAGRNAAAVGGVAEERLNAQAARPLARLVLDPVLAAVGGGPGHDPEPAELVIVPEGPLWLVPWAALPTAEGDYLIERHVVRLATSGRAVAAAGAEPEIAASDRAPGPPLVFAAPDFDLGPPGLLAALGRLDAGAAGSLSPAAGNLAAAAREQRAILPGLGKAPPLPGTKAEAAAIREPLEAFTGAAPEVFLGGAAQETVLKRKAVRPRALVLATHGYFLSDPDATEPARAPDAAVNPLLRCGVLLAGANTAAEPRAAGLDDGVLTGLEVTGLDLAGSGLVVLSACETGVGDLRAGEGVAGLRQAFQIAGAESVVATLWQVPDRESAQIMASFYAQLAAGQPASHALREAQLGFIKARRENRNYEASHPYHWAAYGVTGR